MFYIHLLTDDNTLLELHPSAKLMATASMRKRENEYNLTKRQVGILKFLLDLGKR